MMISKLSELKNSIFPGFLNYLPRYGSRRWSMPTIPSFPSLPSLPNFPNVEHKDKITSLESKVTNLKDLVDQHRDTVNSKFVNLQRYETLTKIFLLLFHI